MFPRVFQGLGSIGEACSIKLKPGSQPRTIYASRNATATLRKSAKRVGKNEVNGSHLFV